MNAASGSGSGFPCAKREIVQAATANSPPADVADAIEGVSVNEPRPPNLGCNHGPMAIGARCETRSPPDHAAALLGLRSRPLRLTWPHQGL